MYKDIITDYTDKPQGKAENKLDNFRDKKSRQIKLIDAKEIYLK